MDVAQLTRDGIVAALGQRDAVPHRKSQIPDEIDAEVFGIKGNADGLLRTDGFHPHTGDVEAGIEPI
jgi:hypothetical protein